jgi:hypothetical protein
MGSVGVNEIMICGASVLLLVIALAAYGALRIIQRRSKNTDFTQKGRVPRPRGVHFALIRGSGNNRPGSSQLRIFGGDRDGFHGLSI